MGQGEKRILFYDMKMEIEIKIIMIFLTKEEKQYNFKIFELNNKIFLILIQANKYTQLTSQIDYKGVQEEGFNGPISELY